MQPKSAVVVLVCLVGCGGEVMPESGSGGAGVSLPPEDAAPGARDGDPHRGDDASGGKDAVVDAFTLPRVPIVPDAMPPPPSSLPPYAPGLCFGEVTLTPNVTCTQSGGGSADECSASITCGGTQLLMSCSGGVCTCVNPVYGEYGCYCAPPPEDQCAPAANCCWQ
jgi:hypothetical protein